MQLTVMPCVSVVVYDENTGNCDYQDRAGKIILSNTAKGNVIGAELHGNFRRNLLAAALKQRNLSLEERLMLRPH
jgi:hypothetical protein